MNKIALVCACLAWLSACSDEGSGKVSRDNEETLLQGHIDTMKKAQNVENVLQEADAQHRELVEQQQK